MDKDEPETGRMKDLAARAGKAAKAAAEKVAEGAQTAAPHVARAGGVAAEKTVQGAQAAKPHVARASGVAAEQVVRGSKAVAPHIVHASDVAKDQAARAAALTAQQARRHMPKHEPGEPVRPALLDAGEMPGPIALDDGADLLPGERTGYCMQNFVHDRRRCHGFGRMSVQSNMIRNDELAGGSCPVRADGGGQPPDIGEEAVQAWPGWRGWRKRWAAEWIWVAV